VRRCNGARARTAGGVIMAHVVPLNVRVNDPRRISQPTASIVTERPGKPLKIMHISNAAADMLGAPCAAVFVVEPGCELCLVNVPDGEPYSLRVREYDSGRGGRWTRVSLGALLRAEPWVSDFVGFRYPVRPRMFRDRPGITIDLLEPIAAVGWADNVDLMSHPTARGI
jgi:hypothetical protein